MATCWYFATNLFVLLLTESAVCCYKDYRVSALCLQYFLIYLLMMLCAEKVTMGQAEDNSSLPPVLMLGFRNVG